MLNKLKLILLEDSDSDAELIEGELTKAGIEFDARRVYSREDFLHGVLEFEPDLILADYTLPQFTALDALAIAK
jgi:DNA-binding response OmpR family regulator